MNSRTKRKPVKRKPFFAWLEELSPGGSLSCLIVYSEREVKEKIRCAKLCKKEKRRFFKFRLTEMV